MMVHIKWEPGDEGKLSVMRDWLTAKGFIVFDSCAAWKHGENHNEQYLIDIRKMVSKVFTPYYCHFEDDWLLSSHSVADELSEAVRVLEFQKDILQVRFPRYSNEYERILSLRERHGIDGKAERGVLGGCLQNDWSNHPYVVRTRDLNAAVRFVFATNLPLHTEHGIAPAMKLLSDSPTPFFSPDVEKIRVGHIGVRTPEERDDLTKPLIAT
jgi:hypothetical protein